MEFKEVLLQFLMFAWFFIRDAVAGIFRHKLAPKKPSSNEKNQTKIIRGKSRKMVTEKFQQSLSSN